MDETQTGRPTLFTQELADRICLRLAEVGNLRAVCREEGMPAESTVRHWVLEDREGFKAKYNDARELGYHAMADEVLDIADDGRNDWMEREGQPVINGEHIARSRLRFDARRWLLSKALPKVYGDKQVIDHRSEDGSMSPQRVELVALKPNDDSADSASS
jgi:hypothetical protein